MIRSFLLSLLAATIAATALRAQEKPVEIASPHIRAVFSANRLALSSPAASQPFLSDITINARPGRPATIKAASHPTWGDGSIMTIEDDTGVQHRVSVYSALPFALLQRVLVNTTATEQRIAQQPICDGLLTLATPAEQLKVMTSAGLRNATEASAGYVYLTVGDPVTRAGVVFCFLTSNRGTGIVQSAYEKNSQRLKAHTDYGDLRIAAGANAESEILAIGYSRDVRLGLEQYADAIATHLQIKLSPSPTVYCTWYHGGASEEKRIARNADFAAEHLSRFGLNVMQIDDRWQRGIRLNGPHRDFSGARADGPYPSGMTATADYLKAKNFTAGIWYIPFAGSWNDPAWDDKRDLFLREGDAKASNYFHKMDPALTAKYPADQIPYEARWGGTCLDLTNPKAIDYVRETAARLSKEWGYHYFKLDGLWTGTGTESLYIHTEYRPDELGKPLRKNPAITPIEAYRNGLKALRAGAAPDMFLLGCCIQQNLHSFGASIGLVDGMRVGPDNGANPDALVRGPQFSSRVFFLDKRVWHNDPDPVYVRKSFPEDMARTSVSWVALAGAMHTSSEQYPELPADRVHMLTRSMPSHSLKTTRPVDYLENDPTRVWLLTDSREATRKDIIGLYNWNTVEAANISYPLDRIGLPPATQYVGFDFWADRFLPPFSGTISGLLPAGGCRIVSIRPVSDVPQVISTSRHVTQGVIDLSQERWDSAQKTLRGVSALIARDPYEVRIVVPVGARSWRVTRVTAEGTLSQPPVSFTQDGPCIRVRIDSTDSQPVNWAVAFEPASVEAIAQAPASIEAKLDTDQIVVTWQGTAPQYQLFKNGRLLGNTTGSRYVDRDIALKETYTYSLRALDWTGQTGPEVKTSVTMPENYQVPPAPPLPDMFTHTMKPVRTVTTTVGKTREGEPITLDGVAQSNSLEVRTGTTLVYDIPAGAKRFVATVAYESLRAKNPQARLSITIQGDVREMGEPIVDLAKSPILSVGQNPVWHFDVELDPRQRHLRLRVENVGTDKAALPVNWINAGFITR
jgi:hypothetical protein